MKNLKKPINLINVILRVSISTAQDFFKLKDAEIRYKNLHHEESYELKI
jgi:hypothetical protein